MIKRFLEMKRIKKTIIDRVRVTTLKIVWVWNLSKTG